MPCDSQKASAQLVSQRFYFAPLAVGRNCQTRRQIPINPESLRTSIVLQECVPRTLILPASSLNVQSDLTHRGVNLSRPLLLRNPGKWEGALSERTCYTMRSYLMAREDRHSDSTRQVGYSVCEPSSTFDVRETVESQNTVTR